MPAISHQRSLPYTQPPCASVRKIPTGPTRASVEKKRLLFSSAASASRRLAAVRAGYCPFGSWLKPFPSRMRGFQVCTARVTTRAINESNITIRQALNGLLIFVKRDCRLRQPGGARSGCHFVTLATVDSTHSGHALGPKAGSRAPRQVVRHAGERHRLALRCLQRSGRASCWPCRVTRQALWFSSSASQSGVGQKTSSLPAVA